MNLFILLGSGSALMFMLLIGYKILKAIQKMDLSELFYANGTTKISHSKFQNVIGFFVATVCFIYFNFALPQSGALEAIQLIYLSVVAGAASLSKYISARFSGNYDHSKKDNYSQDTRPDDYRD